MLYLFYYLLYKREKERRGNIVRNDIKFWVWMILEFRCYNRNKKFNIQFVRNIRRLDKEFIVGYDDKSEIYDV